MRRRVLATACVVMVSGCGGGGKDFVAEANRICQERVDLAERSDAGERTTNAQWAEADEKELEALRELEPPQEQAADFRRMLELYEERTRKQREAAELEAAIDQADSRKEHAELVERQSPVFTAMNRARVQGNEIARALGLDVCGRSLS